MRSGSESKDMDALKARICLIELTTKLGKRLQSKVTRQPERRRRAVVEYFLGLILKRFQNSSKEQFYQNLIVAYY